VVLACAIDDHPVILRGLRAYLEAEAACISLAVIAPTVDAVLADDAHGATVALLDVNLGDASAVGDNVKRLRDAGLNVLLFTGEHRPAIVRRALDAGALGLVLKDDPEASIVTALHEGNSGRFVVSGALAHQIATDPRGAIRLSERETEVLGLLARGLPWTTIARQLRLSVETARTHCYRAIEKYARAGAPVSLGPKNVAFQAVADGHVDTPARGTASSARGGALTPGGDAVSRPVQ
jgi:DNA-binding NarL/FixJ family response regulator